MKELMKNEFYRKSAFDKKMKIIHKYHDSYFDENGKKNYAYEIIDAETYEREADEPCWSAVLEYLKNGKSSY